MPDLSFSAELMQGSFPERVRGAFPSMGRDSHRSVCYKKAMKLFMAPMEGVVDALTREVLTRIGGIDQCVTEFIRVTHQLVPRKVYLRECPELLQSSRTASGCPVFVQLLGGDPICLAENAAFAVELGACGIDLNFGCPAKTVNRHDGGASLLLAPHRIFHIVEAVRRAVPAGIPVSAKIRLGFSDPATCVDNAEAAHRGGAAWLTVHCRTKMDLYKPPAFWEWIPRIRERVPIPIVANGDIWSVEDFQRCRDVTGCDQFMIGRGALRDPFLFRRIRNFVTNETQALPYDWHSVFEVLRDFFERNWEGVSPHYAQARTKQWLRSLSIGHPQGLALFDRVKGIHDPSVFRDLIHEGRPDRSDSNPRDFAERFS